MEIKALASGSSGNCYMVDSGPEKIMIECGLPISQIKRKGGFNVHAMQACLVSHEH